jgi:putative sterol carrier protein
MTDATADFFGDLGRPEEQPKLGSITGTIRVDLDHGKSTDHWLLTIDSGSVTVSNRNAKADAIVHADKQLFDRVVRGEANAMASILRGLITVEGNPAPLVELQRTFPSPPSSQNPQPASAKER